VIQNDKTFVLKQENASLKNRLSELLKVWLNSLCQAQSRMPASIEKSLKLVNQLNSSMSEGSTVSAKEDQEVGRKKKIYQHANKAKDTMKATPTTPPRAKVNGFSTFQK
jgi:hypothetical protein